MAPIFNCSSVDFNQNTTFPVLYHACAGLLSGTQHERIRFVFYFINTVVACISVIAFVENLLVLVVYVKFSFLRTAERMILLSLSMSDLLAAVTLSFTVLFLELATEETEKVLCTCLSTALFIVSTCQIGSLLILTIYRWVSVVYSMRSRQLLRKSVIRKVVVGMWVVVVGVSGAAGVYPSDRWSPETICQPFSAINLPILVITSAVLIVIPLLAIPVLYFHLFHVARKHRRDMLNNMEMRVNVVDADSNSSQGRKTLGAIIVTFYLSWLTVFVSEGLLQIPTSTFDTALAQFAVANFVVTLLFASSALNPLIYHSSSPDVRKAFFMLMCRRRYMQQRREEMLSTLSGRLKRTKLQAA